MILHKMTATFGKLDGSVLELKEGLNIITAPNEGGKSTWCSFLRAMLYGISTRERDTKTTLAEKNRWAPWSGTPMAGEVELTWRGRDITLRRFSKNGAPFGGFEAVYTGTGEPAAELTGDTCGQILLGVGRETFQRSAFVGQSGIPIDADPELERRIAALVSSGEEDVSYSETAKTLRGWLNRRKHNKSGSIPKLEAELEQTEAQLIQLRQLVRQSAETDGIREELSERKDELEAESAAQKARQDWVRQEQYRAAAAELETAQGELAALEREAGPLPEKEALRQAQGELAYWNTLTANLRVAQNNLEPAWETAKEAREAAQDPLFSGLTPDEAWRQAEADYAVAAKKTGNAIPWLILFFAAAIALMVVDSLGLHYAVPSALAILMVVFVMRLLWVGQKTKARQQVLDRYGATYPVDIQSRANAYREKWTVVAEAEQRLAAIKDSVAAMSAQQDGLRERLLAFVHAFAPGVSDVFGVSAALSRALSLDERLATARVKAEGARKLAASIPMPAGPMGQGRTPPPPTSHNPAETAAALAAVNGELSRVERELATLQGHRTSLGDPDRLEADRDALSQALSRRLGEHRALSLALEELDRANAELQIRFSPELNRRAGELFCALTGGRYEGVTLNREFEAEVRPAGDILPRRALSLSRGTTDQLYLAVRLAVCDMALPGGDPAPLVLDDALADFDDQRMALALETLGQYAQGRQVLLFTCHSREEDWRKRTAQ